jgi:hypothetical protein
VSSHTGNSGIFTLTNSSNDLSTCSVVATTNTATAGGAPSASVSAAVTGQHTIVVNTYNNLSQLADEAFSLIVTC